MLLVLEGKGAPPGLESGPGGGGAVLLGLGPELDSMAETETMAPRMMEFEITVPYTMGTLDKKRIGLTSWA